MITSPFDILRPFENLSVTLFTKEDDVRSDTDAAKKIGVKNAAGLNQVHGNRVIVVRESTARTDEADGMITDVPNLALCIRWADCQNFVVYEPKKRILGAMHVGWKCLRAGTIPSFFKVLNDEFGIDGKDCLVGGGPSLCMRCSEFTDPLKEIENVPREFVTGRNVDLRGWALKQLMDAGAVNANIEIHPDCTRCNPEKYWTYRGGDREAVITGHTNMLSVALRRI